MTDDELLALAQKALEVHGSLQFDMADMARAHPESTIALIERQRAEVERLTRENNVLRGIATKIMPCHYCGADELAKCPYGFPGCALADDLFPADETQATWMADLRKRAEAAEAALAAAEARVREECAKIALYQGHPITAEMIRAGGGR